MVERFWSRVPGKFVEPISGDVLVGSFSGTIRQWYEGLIDMMLSATEQVLREAGGVAVPDCSWCVDSMIKVIIESSVSYRPDLDAKPNIGVIGEDMPGFLCNIPVSASVSLYGTGRVELHRVIDGVDVLIGIVSVLDHPPS